jgi:hypothetical protein
MERLSVFLRQRSGGFQFDLIRGTELEELIVSGKRKRGEEVTILYEMLFDGINIPFG